VGSLESVAKRIIADISDEIMSLNNFKTTNPYVARVIKERIDKLYIGIQEIEDEDFTGF